MELLIEVFKGVAIAAATIILGIIVYKAVAEILGK